MPPPTAKPATMAAQAAGSGEPAPASVAAAAGAAVRTAAATVASAANIIFIESIHPEALGNCA